jgi:hypothetical protein
MIMTMVANNPPKQIVPLPSATFCIIQKKPGLIVLDYSSKPKKPAPENLDDMKYKTLVTQCRKNHPILNDIETITKPFCHHQNLEWNDQRFLKENMQNLIKRITIIKLELIYFTTIQKTVRKNPLWKNSDFRNSFIKTVQKYNSQHITLIELLSVKSHSSNFTQESIDAYYETLTEKKPLLRELNLSAPYVDNFLQVQTISKPPKPTS